MILGLLGKGLTGLNSRKFVCIKFSRRWYHENESFYGYRLYKPATHPDYSEEARENQIKNANLLRLIRAYRTFGHWEAHLDPLNLKSKTAVSDLDPALYGLEEKQYDLVGLLHGLGSDHREAKATLSQIIKHLQRTYCGSLTFEFEHIPNPSERRWFAEYVEELYSPHKAAEKKKLTIEKERILGYLSRSEVFDQFMQKKFPQVKRYGLEGGESLVPCLAQIIDCSSAAALKGAVIGMPHRGRLNLLADLFGYSPTRIFSKVRGESELPEGVPGMADVLSHLYCKVEEKSLSLTLLPNPSHLEAINPVAVGKTRAKQIDEYNRRVKAGEDPQSCAIGDNYLCIQIHGDAAFCGQGVVMETLGLSNLAHFSCGGSIHIILNNQIGYTTAAENSRSSVYTSDIAKMINCPIIHVNGDYPEDVALAAKVAFDYRNRFRKDVIIDLIVYRRWGHNELDEPGFTQPIMYKLIRARESVPRLYEKKLIKESVVQIEQVENIRTEWFRELDSHFDASASYKVPKLENGLEGKWKDCIVPTYSISQLDTGFNVEKLREIGLASVTFPSEMKIHARLLKYHIEERKKDLQVNSRGIDWATAEALAFGSLLYEGYGVRISGQDVGRGTFSQRHIMLVDQETEHIHVPLNSDLPKPTAEGVSPGKLEIANSSLSEFAVLGFEYGCSWESSPHTLFIWEAQFGDFFNGAQIIIDTFISGGESKWMKQSNLVMLLPHGYDGAGPEHSSCRYERFLQLCDEKVAPAPEINSLNQEASNSSTNPICYTNNVNMHVVFPTTPAQYFHVLRRQMKRNFRKPLIVIGPKGLLRHPKAVSPLDDATVGPNSTFQPILFDKFVDRQEVTKLVLVSGKFYYDLEQEREKRNCKNIALVRVEELCPFPFSQFEELFYGPESSYPYLREVIWAQEEPLNMGAYSYIAPRIASLLPPGLGSMGSEGHGLIPVVCREAAAIPATGISKVHKREQAELIAKVFSD